MLRTWRCDPFRVWSSTTQLTVLLLLIECSRHAFTWHTNYVPKSQYIIDELSSSETQKFDGNLTSPDNFKLLLTDGNSIIVGARNYLYNISLLTLKQNKKLEWYAKKSDVNKCVSLSKTRSECQNYVRVVVKTSSENIYVCGTHAFDPKCRVYKILPDTYGRNQGYYKDSKDMVGIAQCPYDPSLNSTALYFQGGSYFTATYASPGDALIYTGSIRTEQYDSKWLNKPNFVSSFEYQDRIYFFFRETGVEYINCGKRVYSRVARICKNDNGGRMVLRDVFTSFFKARLNCSIPGEFPFYFDEIQSTTNIGRGNIGATNHSLYRNEMIYGVFNTPENSITGSAICAYKFLDVLRTFESDFKEQNSAQSAWLPVKWSWQQRYHPAKQCVNDTKQIPDVILNFIQSHTLMDEAVPVFGGRPILVHTSFNSRFTQIAVDWQVLAADRNYYDVMFIGLDDGRVIKAVNKGHDRKIDTVVIEEIQVFEDKSAVTNLKVYKNKGEEKLIVISGNEIRSIPLHRCHVQKTCRDCVALQDPYCSWLDNMCANSISGFEALSTGKSKRCKQWPIWTTKNLATTTKSIVEPTCPPCKCTVDSTLPDETNELPPHVPPSSTKNDTFFPNVIEMILPHDGKMKGIGSSTQKVGQYSATTLAIALALSVVLALVLGIIVGYRIAMCRRTRNDLQYLEKYQKGDLEQTRRNCNENYITPSQQKQLNVVLNVKPKPNSGKLPNGSADNKPLHKVKKVYV